MEKTLQRIEEALANNWAVEAEDIRHLIKLYKGAMKHIAKLEKESPNHYTKT